MKFRHKVLICNIIFVAIALAGVFLFRERLQKRQWSAIGLILLSVALLNL